MQPYYADDKAGIVLYHGDCRDVLPILTGDATITDPPYGEINADTEWKIETDEYAALLHCTPVAALFCSFSFALDNLHPAMRRAKWRYWTNFVWAKQAGGFKTHAHIPCYDHEHIACYRREGLPVSELIFNGYDAGEQREVYANSVIKNSSKATTGVYSAKAHTRGFAHPEGKRWITSVLRGVSKTGMPLDERTEHPTQKPLEVVMRLVLLLTNPGQIVIDPFMGSGTTLEAAKRLGRRAIGIEIEERYCDIAARRLSQEVMDFSL